MIQYLIKHGATVPSPETVFIGEEVVPERIAGKGVVIHPGCRIRGSKTLIMPGVELGEEGPVTVENCQLGCGVRLKGGFFSKSVFLGKSAMGSGAHVRAGCLLEEEASGAHCVGLKQTILFPFVTLGSLVNFCDCLMAGGTSRDDHSEVGSSYIHFNYTPNQDKATPSLIGDVPRGVLLNQAPIFLGGQGGLVGPLRVEFGTVAAAGVILRKDVIEQRRLVPDALKEGGQGRHIPGVYKHVKNRVINNVLFIANLLALRQWYRHVRRGFLSRDDMGMALFDGAMECLSGAVQERIRRFEELARKMPESIKGYKLIAGKMADERLVEQKKQLHERWGDLKALFEERPEERFASFTEDLPAVAGIQGDEYIKTIRGLDATTAAAATRWLQGMVDNVYSQALSILSFYG